MLNILRRPSVAFIEPTNIFEQLEERIVLDATVVQPVDQNVDQDNTLDVDVDAADEGAEGFFYELEIKEGAGVFQSLDEYNEGNGDGADIGFDAFWGKIGWTPNNVNVGDYTFKVTANDGGNPPDTDAKTFAVSVKNIAPVINTAATATFQEDKGFQSFNIGVGNNDEGYGATYSFAANKPSWLEIDADTGVLYGNPENKDVGEWDFTVKVDDGHGGTDTQDFKLTVDNVDPTFQSATEVAFDATGGIQYFDVNTSDESSDNSGAAPTDKFNKYYLQDLPPGLAGKISINEDTGLITAAADLTGQVGDHTFKIRFSDGSPPGGQDYNIEQDFTLHITDTPLGGTQFFSADATTWTEDGGIQRFDIQYENEGTPGVLYTLTGAPSWLQIDDATGEIWGNPTNSGVGDDKFTVKVDGQTQDFTLTVTNVATRLTTLPFATFTERVGMQTYDVGSTDEGVGAKYSLGAGGPAGIQIGETTGIISLNPTNAQVGTYTFKVNVDDQHGGTDSQDFTLTIKNTAPKFLNVQRDFYVTESQPAAEEFDVQVDEEATGLNGYSIVSVDGVAGAPGWLSIDPQTGIISATPLDPQVGNHTVIVEFTDGNIPAGDPKPRMTVHTHVQNVVTYYTSPAATTWTEDLAGQTFNVETHEEAWSTYSFKQDGKVTDGGLLWDGWVRINVNDGTLSIEGTPPDNSRVGDHTFRIQCDEGHGDPFVEQAFTLTVLNVAPEIDTATPPNPANSYPPDAFEVQEGATDTFQVHLVETSEPGAQYSLIGAPGFVTIDKDTGLMTITGATNDDVGIYPFTIRVDDTKGGIANEMFIIEVANTPPTLTPDGPWTAIEDLSDTKDLNYFSHDLTSDQEGVGPTTYSIVGGSAAGWVNIDSKTGVISGTPDDAAAESAQPQTLIVQVNDGHGGTDTETYKITVSNAQPQFTSSTSAKWTEDAGTQTFNVQTDDEGQGATEYTLLDGPGAGDLVPTWLTINKSSGVMQYSPRNAQVGVYTFQIQVDDKTTSGLGEISTNVQTFTLTVENEAPEWLTIDNAYFEQNAGKQNV